MAPRPGKDPLFTDEDVAEILDYLADEGLICGGCGQPKAESFHPDNEDSYRATPLACFACATKARAAKKIDDLDGVYTVVEKVR